MPTASEIELKFSIDDPAVIGRKLRELGFTSDGQVFERNVVFDSPDGGLRSNGKLLRLRSDRKVKLTWKETPEDADPGSRYKVKRESELEIGDFETMRHIFHRMGYTSERVYEKYREHFVREDGVAAELDRLPHIGDFLELEAPPEEIESVAAALGLDTADGRRENYFTLFGQWCEREGQRYEHMKFEDERPTA